MSNSVIVDTCVWVDHFKNRNDELVRLLQMDLVLMHPLVLGELACGSIPSPRSKTLRDLGLLQFSKKASFDEALALIESEKLYGKGCGLVDMYLLASTLISTGAVLWTFDKKLSALASQLEIDFKTMLPQ